MSMHAHTIAHSNRVACPGCGTNGILRWEDSSSASGRQLVAIEGSFHERLAKKPPHAIELVCEACGTAQKAA